MYTATGTGLAWRECLRLFISSLASRQGLRACGRRHGQQGGNLTTWVATGSAGTGPPGTGSAGWKE
eukprot:scaffold40277_cov14-Tisochrysis_lutea.AAC.1